MEVGFLIIDVLSKMKAASFWSIEFATMTVDVSSWIIDVGSCAVEVIACYCHIFGESAWCWEKDNCDIGVISEFTIG